MYKKLHSRSAGPYKVLRKISSNAYVLDLLDSMGISNVFNIEDLTIYHGHDDDDVTFCGGLMSKRIRGGVVRKKEKRDI
jgi:hypothetical protein